MVSIFNLVVEKELKYSLFIRFLENKEYRHPSNFHLIYYRILFIRARLDLSSV